jgi:two-component system, NarL family, response regulator
MNQKTPIRILIADDHPVVRAGLIAMLSIQPEENLLVVGEASNGSDAVSTFASLQPDITLMDLRMPVMDGVAAIAKIRGEFPTARIIVLTTYDGDADIYQGLQAGANAYLLKDAPREELLKCIRVVHAGESFILPKVGAKLLEHMSQPELSGREREVLGQMATGRSNQEIGTVLTIAEGTVKFHVNNILHKLQAKDRTEAVIKALKRGIIQL